MFLQEKLYGNDTTIKYQHVLKEMCDTGCLPD